jgi:hypothetical protein
MGRYSGRSHNVFEVLSVASRRACGGIWRRFVLVTKSMRKSGEEYEFPCHAMTILDALLAISMQHCVGLQLRNGGSGGCREMRTQLCCYIGLTLQANPNV